MIINIISLNFWAGFVVGWLVLITLSAIIQTAAGGEK